MAAVHRASFPPREAWSKDVFVLQLELPNVVALLHEEGGLIVTRAAADEAEVLTLAVVPEARRGGVATALLHAAAEELAIRGVSALFLEVSVINQPAHALYQRIGFAEVGRRRQYYADKSDALVLRLDLPPVP